MITVVVERVDDGFVAMCIENGMQSFGRTSEDAVNGINEILKELEIIVIGEMLEAS